MQDVAGIDRLQPAQLLDAGRAKGRRLEQVAVAQHSHRHRAGVPAACGEAAEERRLGGSVVEMKGLGIEVAREREHGFAGDFVVAELADLADRKVFPEGRGAGKAVGGSAGGVMAAAV